VKVIWSWLCVCVCVCVWTEKGSLSVNPVTPSREDWRKALKERKIEGSEVTADANLLQLSLSTTLSLKGFMDTEIPSHTHTVLPRLHIGSAQALEEQSWAVNFYCSPTILRLTHTHTHTHTQLVNFRNTLLMEEHELIRWVFHTHTHTHTLLLTFGWFMASSCHTHV